MRRNFGVFSVRPNRIFSIRHAAHLLPYCGRIQITFRTSSAYLRLHCARLPWAYSSPCAASSRAHISRRAISNPALERTCHARTLQWQSWRGDAPMRRARAAMADRGERRLKARGLMRTNSDSTRKSASYRRCRALRFCPNSPYCPVRNLCRSMSCNTSLRMRSPARAR